MNKQISRKTAIGMGFEYDIDAKMWFFEKIFDADGCYMQFEKLPTWQLFWQEIKSIMKSERELGKETLRDELKDKLGIE